VWDGVQQLLLPGQASGWRVMLDFSSTVQVKWCQVSLRETRSNICLTLLCTDLAGQELTHDLAELLDMPGKLCILANHQRSAE
jgi:hypothetical protein